MLVTCSVCCSEKCFKFVTQAYFSIALQISSVVLLAFLSVMAKFLERLASRRVTLFAAFWDTLLFVQERSTTGPWDLVLKSSSNLSRSSSCRWVTVCLLVLNYIKSMKKLGTMDFNMNLNSLQLFQMHHLFFFLYVHQSGLSKVWIKMWY